MFPNFLKIKRKNNHIALFLTVIFFITFLPFNALHHHAEDEHRMALASHQKNHSCELDEHICQGEFTDHCQHASHISTTIVKCFFCQFHFEKNYEETGMQSTIIYSVDTKSHFEYITHAAITAAKLISNKGPPVKELLS